MTHFILCSICHKLKTSSDDPRICLDCAIEIADIGMKARPLFSGAITRPTLSAARMPVSDFAALSTYNQDLNDALYQDDARHSDRVAAGRVPPSVPPILPEPQDVPPQYINGTPEEVARSNKIVIAIAALLVVLFVAPIIACAIARPELFNFKSRASEERAIQLTWFYKGVYAACVFDIVGDVPPPISVRRYCEDKIAQYRESKFDSFFDLPLSGEESAPESLRRPSSQDRAMQYRSLLASTSSSALAALQVPISALQVFDALRSSSVLDYQVTLPNVAPIAFFGLTLAISCGVIVFGVVLYRKGE